MPQRRRRGPGFPLKRAHKTNRPRTKSGRETGVFQMLYASVSMPYTCTSSIRSIAILLDNTGARSVSPESRCSTSLTGAESEQTASKHTLWSITHANGMRQQSFTRVAFVMVFRFDPEAHFMMTTGQRGREGVLFFSTYKTSWQGKGRDCCGW